MAITKRDLQKLIEVSQRDLDSMRYKNVKKYKADFVKRFAKTEWYKGDADFYHIADIQSDLFEITKHLRDWKKTGTWEIIEYTRDPNDKTGVAYDDESLRLVVIKSWKVFLKETFIEALDMIKLDNLDFCPQCGSLFLRVGKTKKTYCTSNCAARSKMD